jgi:hypothetical protein
MKSCHPSVRRHASGADRLTETEVQRLVRRRRLSRGLYLQRTGHRRYLHATPGGVMSGPEATDREVHAARTSAWSQAHLK